MPAGPKGFVERVDASAFDGRRLRRRGAVAVAFSADWCPFCRAFLPEFAQAASREADLGFLVADLTSMASPLWEQFEIEIVPTLLLFRDGAPVARRDGVAGEGLGPHDLDTVLAVARGAGPETPAGPR